MNVAIVTKRFLDLSETFIYQPLQIISQREQMFVYALERRNPQDFPYEQLYTLDSLSPRSKSLALLLGTFGYEPNILRKMRADRIQLIHAHYGYMGLYAQQFACRLKLPLMVSFYGLDVYKHTGSAAYRWQLKSLFRRAAVLTVCSAKMKQDLIDLGADTAKVKVIYGGVDLQKYQYRPAKADGKTTILMCGRFVEKKGFIYGIKAFKAIADNNIELKIIGSGPLEQQLKEEAASDQRIEFLGNRSYEQYMQQLQSAAVLMVPSVTAADGDQEGLPTVLIEASALGTIIVATRHSGIPEIVANGYLAAERDVADLQQQLSLALSQKGTWEHLADKQYAHVAANFDIHQQAEKIRRLYSSLCEK